MQSIKLIRYSKEHMRHTLTLSYASRLFGSIFAMGSKLDMPTAGTALPGRGEAIAVSKHHAVNGNAMNPPFPENMFSMAMFGMGCFWGVERKFWQQPGVYSTQVGYSGGFTENASYNEVCSGQTGHNEVVRVVFETDKTSYADLLKVFWENHDPTQGMRQGNDQGTQYRSGIYYYNEEQKVLAEQTKQQYAQALTKSGHGAITTEIIAAEPFYYAEDYHQQYLHKNPGGYCNLRGTGVGCPKGLKLGGKDEL